MSRCSISLNKCSQGAYVYLDAREAQAPSLKRPRIPGVSASVADEEEGSSDNDIQVPVLKKTRDVDAFFSVGTHTHAHLLTRAPWLALAREIQGKSKPLPRTSNSGTRAAPCRSPLL